MNLTPGPKVSASPRLVHDPHGSVFDRHNILLVRIARIESTRRRTMPATFVINTAMLDDGAPRSRAAPPPHALRGEHSPREVRDKRSRSRVHLERPQSIKLRG